MSRTKQGRKGDRRLINLWVPEPLLAPLDSAVSALDLDRSKFIRAAIREKLTKHSIKVDPAVAS